MDGDWIQVLERLYDTEAPTDAWLRALSVAAERCLPDAAVVAAYSYDASQKTGIQFANLTVSHEGGGWGEKLARMMSLPVGPDYVDRTYRTKRAGSVVDTLREDAPLARPEDFQAATGIADVHSANGIDGDGHGLWLGGCVETYVPFEGALRQSFERIGSHLAVAWRLHRRLAPTPGAAMTRAEAVLSPDGRVQHAKGPATLRDSRASLTRAVRAIDLARTRAHRTDPALGLTEWRGLVARRWSLLEVFESDGKRFLLAQENAMPTPTSTALTTREREVAQLATLGISNKLVAYELGITAATVGVLLHRAMKKLGLPDRSGLRAALDAQGDAVASL